MIKKINAIIKGVSKDDSHNCKVNYDSIQDLTREEVRVSCKDRKKINYQNELLLFTLD